MRTRPLAFIAAAAVSLAFVTLGISSARADLAPPDACTAPGQPCHNAGPQYDQAGTCTATSCTKAVPNGNGGTTTMKYDCNLCQTEAADAGGGGGKSSGCSIALGRPLGATASLTVAVALLGIAHGRRRRPGR